jgi:hypothetical protein
MGRPGAPPLTRCGPVQEATADMFSASAVVQHVNAASVTPGAGQPYVCPYVY